MGCVLVLDGRSRAALQIVRSLGKRGIDVCVGNEHWACSSFFSKYVSKRLVYPPPGTGEFRECIFRFLRENDVDLVIPVRDDTTVFCAEYQQELSEITRTFVVDLDTLMIGRDKSQTFAAAEKLGIPCPETQVANSADELLDTSIRFPAILKPAISSGSRGLYKVNDRKELENLSRRIFQEYRKYLIQDYIPTRKHVVGANVLFGYDSKPCAVFTYERLRDYPRGNGPSVLRQSTKDENLKRLTLRLFEGLRWKGVAMAEFKIDSRDGIPKLMEINPRFWGSLSLPIFSGIDFPHLLYQLAMGDGTGKAGGYRVGARTRWLLLGDLLWLATSSSLARDLPEFFKFFGKELAYDILSWADPLPSLGAILEGFQLLVDPLKRKHAFDRGKS